MKKIFFVIFLIFIVACVGLYFYLNKVFLPYKLKDILTTKLQETLRRKITYEAMDFHFPGKIAVRQLAVFEKNSSKIFFKADQVSFSLILTGLIQNHTLVVSSFSVDAPNLTLEKQTASDWNFTDLITSKTDEKPSSSPPSNRPSSSFPLKIITKKITINKGQLTLRDLSNKEPFVETFQDLNVGATIHLNQTVDFKLSTSVPEKSLVLAGSGKFDINNMSLSSDIKLKNVPLAVYLKTFVSLPLLTVHDGNIATADVHLDYAAHRIKLQGSAQLKNMAVDGKSTGDVSPIFKTIKGNITLDNFLFDQNADQIQGQARANIDTALIKLNDEQALTGNITADIDSLNMTQEAMRLNGKIKIDQTKVSLGSDRTLEGNLAVENIVLDKKDDTTVIKADAALTSSHIQINPKQTMTGDLSLARSLLTIKDKKISLRTEVALKDGHIQSDQIKIDGTITAPKFNISLMDQTLALEGTLNVDQGQIQLDESKTFIGNPKLSLKLKTNLSDPSALTYSGSVSLTDATLTGLPRVKDVQHLSGNVQFQDTSLKTEKLSFHTLDTDFIVSGALDGFTKPLVSAQISSDDIDFEKLMVVLPEDVAQKIPVKLKGHSSLELKIKGPLLSLPEAEISCLASVKNVEITHEKLLSPIKNLNGQIEYANNFIMWKNLEAEYQNKKYKSSGKVVNFKKPNIAASLSSDDLSVNADVTTENDLLKINELKGKFIDSIFYVTGNVDHPGSAEADVDISYESSVNLADLSKFPIDATAKIKPMDPSGEITLNGKIKGKGMDWRAWEISSQAQSSLINILKYPIEDFKLSYHQSNGAIDLFESTAKIYDGNFKFQAKGDVKDKDIPLEIATELNRLNLETLRKKQQLTTSNLQGMLSLDLVGNGSLLSLDSFKGTGNVTIAEGILWESNILQGILGSLLIPEFQNVIFTDAHADFNVADKKITTQNAEVISKNVTLKANGWAGFDQNIDFVVNPEFSEIALLSSDSLKKAPTDLLTQSIAIHVTGTLKEPKFRADTSVKKVLQNTTNVIKEGVKGILDQIF